MKATTREMLSEGRRLEQAGQVREAAGTYQKIVDDDPGNQEAVGRLLVVYRKLKEYHKELAVIDRVLAAYERTGKELRERWVREHPKAAGAGKAIFRKMGGAGVEVLGANPVVGGLLKRKAFVEKRLGTGKRGKGGKKVVDRKVARPAGLAARQKRKAAKDSKDAAAAARRQAVEQRKQEAAAAKQAAELRRREAAARKVEKLAAKKAAAEAKLRPSLFVISLRYLVRLEEIDAAMPQHMAFLERHYKAGEFLVSGRQVPRTGGIIIARGKNRATIERMMSQDPFVRKKLASVDIVEFSASQVGKGINFDLF